MRQVSCRDRGARLEPEISDRGDMMSNARNVEAPIHEPMLIAGKRVDGPMRIEDQIRPAPTTWSGRSSVTRPPMSTQPLLPRRRRNRPGWR